MFIEKSGVIHAFVVPCLCVAYMTSSSAVIIANQRIIKNVGFTYPILLSALGTTVSAATAHISVAVGLASVRPEARNFRSGKSWLGCVVPVALCQAGTFAFGNAVYLRLGVSFSMMLKAGTPISVLLVLSIMRLETPSPMTTFFVCLITLGTAITATATPEWDTLGVAYASAAMVTEALRVGLTQFLLKSCNFSVTEGQYVLAPTVSIALLVLSAVMEIPEAVTAGALWKVAEFPGQFAIAAGLGSVVNYFGYLVIKSCGGLTLKLVTTLRNVYLVVYGAIVLGEAISLIQGVGYFVALVGFAGYTYCGSSIRGISASKLPAESHVKQS